MSLKTFEHMLTKLARNPLGIIALAFVLVYGIAGLLTVQGNFQPNERIVLVWFLVIFPFFVLFVFYFLVSRHHDKLYAPSDFSNDENFVKIVESKIEQSPRLNHLEELTKRIKEEIENQPLYRYTKLSEAGKVLTLEAFRGEAINLKAYTERRKFAEEEVKKQAKILAEYGWLVIENGQVSITEKGKKEVSTFEDICYGRFR